MTERFFTQLEWQGIKFSELDVRLNPNEPASAEFYAAFYRELKRRYATYDQLPGKWRETKNRTADYIAGLVPPAQSVLSYGCGIGIIEDRLVRTHRMEHLRLWDFAPTAAHFNPEIRPRYLPSLVDLSSLVGMRFDTILLIQVLYALRDDEAVETLRGLRQVVLTGGRVITVDTSSDPRENGIVSPHRKRILDPARVASLGVFDPLRAMVRRVRSSTPIVGEQGWGWARDNASVESILRRAGFTSVYFETCAGQSVAIAR